MGYIGAYAFVPDWFVDRRFAGGGRRAAIRDAMFGAVRFKFPAY